MVDAKRQDETVEYTEEFVIIRMHPDEAAILQSYLGHISFDQQREYLTDEVVDLLQAMHQALEKDVPAAPLTVTKPPTISNKPPEAPAPATKQANVFD